MHSTLSVTSPCPLEMDEQIEIVLALSYRGLFEGNSGNGNFPRKLCPHENSVLGKFRRGTLVVAKCCQLNLTKLDALCDKLVISLLVEVS